MTAAKEEVKVVTPEPVLEAERIAAAPPKNVRFRASHRNSTFIDRKGEVHRFRDGELLVGGSDALLLADLRGAVKTSNGMIVEVVEADRKAYSATQQALMTAMRMHGDQEKVQENGAAPSFSAPRSEVPLDNPQEAQRNAEAQKILDERAGNVPGGSGEVVPAPRNPATPAHPGVTPQTVKTGLQTSPQAAKK